MCLWLLCVSPPHKSSGSPPILCHISDTGSPTNRVMSAPTLGPLLMGCSPVGAQSGAHQSYLWRATEASFKMWHMHCAFRVIEMHGSVQSQRTLKREDPETRNLLLFSVLGTEVESESQERHLWFSQSCLHSLHSGSALRFLARRTVGKEQGRSCREVGEETQRWWAQGPV